MKSDRPTGIVMNMFATGLGIARSLGENQVPVIGLTSQRGVYGNLTRYADVRFSPDSRTAPEALCEYLVALGKRLRDQSSGRGVIFPTRDDDVVFLDRYREELAPYFVLAIPKKAALEACMNKWLTCQYAAGEGIGIPRSWCVENEGDLYRIKSDLVFPCVMKPVASYQWRRNGHGHIMGGRKAVRVESLRQLFPEYSTISLTRAPILVQEMIPGSEEGLVSACCYMNERSELVAGFTTRKLVQNPPDLGIGCVVQAIDHPEMLRSTVRLLQSIKFSGIAEAEFKLDPRSNQYKLIEINPRPWNQHRLGTLCGVDLAYIAYCDYAGLGLPPIRMQVAGQKWIAEDDILMAAACSIRNGDRDLSTLLRLARGKRTFAIWSSKDPLPFLSYLGLSAIPFLVGNGFRYLARGLRRKAAALPDKSNKEVEV